LSLGRRLLDAVDYHWTRLVLTYDLGRQLELARRARQQLRRVELHWPTPATAAALAVAVAAAAGLLLWRRRRFSPGERLLRRFLRLVRRRHGLEPLPPSTGLQELAERLDDPLCREFAAIYGGALYRDRPLTPDERRRLRAILRQLRRAG
jgi:hypothetical protein